MNEEQLWFKKLFSGIAKESRIRECLHPDKASCSDNIVNAHSIQNNRILSRIAVNGEVMMFNLDSFLGEGMHNTGRKSATTFSGFCGKHDNILFLPIESREYVKGDTEQEFLFSYRAIARELNIKKTTKNIYELMLKKLSEGNLQGNSKFMELHLAGTIEGIKNLEIRFDKMNQCLLGKDFTQIVTQTFILRGEYLIAVNSIFYPLYSPNGAQVNEPMLLKNLQPLFLTVFPQNGFTYVLFSYSRDEEKVQMFIDELKVIEEQSKKKFIKIITLLILGYCENFVYSPKIWSKISKREKIEIDEIYRGLTPSLPPPEYLQKKDVPNLFRS